MENNTGGTKRYGCRTRIRTSAYWPSSIKDLRTGRKIAKLILGTRTINNLNLVPSTIIHVVLLVL